MRELANLSPCLVGMEACCGAHHLGQRLVTFGHTVRLIPPQFVKPFVKSQKNDLLDAEAIAEAVQRPTMRFVPLKTTDQLDLQAIHRVRTRLVRRRTAVINQLRAFLLERGVTFPVGRRALLERFPEVLNLTTRPLTCRRACLGCSSNSVTNGATWTRPLKKPIMTCPLSRARTRGVGG
jgi:transposase